MVVENSGQKEGCRMRVAILWTGLSGYLNACLKELASREGVELFVSHQATEEQVPFDDNQYAWIPKRLVWRSRADLAPLGGQLRAFDPEILVFSGWHVPAYRRIARGLAKRCRRVMAIDNPWEATLKQRVGTLIAPWYIRPLADAVWVPGERQAAFARRLGFEQRAILWGLLSCDQPAIETVHLSRLADGRAVPRSFLFVGTFVSDKGVDQLVRAYAVIPGEDQSTLGLWSVAVLALWVLVWKADPGFASKDLCSQTACATYWPQPDASFCRAALNHWGVVVHEAASAGLLILASENVGAAVHLVQDNYNGYIFDGRDVEGLAALMSHVGNLSEARLDAMSRASHLLSKQYSPARWADALLDGFRRFSGY